jgi:single-strand DNA-binding protein
MINKVILVGNVGADPEIRSLESGVKVARLRLATTERIYNRQTQETKEHTEWHTVVLWRGLADVADKYVRKGSQIYVEGSLRSNEWTDKEGNKRYGMEIVANDMKLLGRRSGEGSSSSGVYAGSGSSAPQYSAPAPSQSYAPAKPAAAPVPEPLPVDDPDDLPF